MKLFVALLLLISSASAQATCVILLHGLARTNNSMVKMEEQLSENGFYVVNLGYPSREFTVEILAEKAIAPALKACENHTDINFVTHSLGGILIRQYLLTHDIPNLNHVVMLGPPNQGSEVVDQLHSMPGFHFLNGDAGLQIGTNSMSGPNNIGPASFDLGIIAGTQSINWILSALIPGDDDGKVSIENTKLEGMNDHIEMDTTHPFMMKNDKVIAQVIYYLHHGHFDHSNDAIQ